MATDLAAIVERFDKLSVKDRLMVCAGLLDERPEIAERLLERTLDFLKLKRMLGRDIK